VLLGLGLVPLVVSSGFWLNFLIMVFYASVLGQAWNLLGGYGGQFSFGHAAFFGTGAYAVAVLQVQLGVNPWLAFGAGIVFGAAMGLLIGFLCFRYGLKGSYFALVTLAFAEVLRILSNSVPFTGAGVGILIPLERTAANFQFADREGFYYVALLLCGAALALAWWLERSRFGAWLVAVRDNEEAARALGVDVFRVKLAAITVSGALMAAGGGFYAQYFLYLDPYIAFGPAVSVEALLVAIVGGLGTVFGPLLGAGVLHLVSELARELLGEVPGLQMVLYGLILILMVLFLPNGLFGLARVSAQRLLRWVR
jgi:branched-chain amino acid transport system permease protein